MDDNDSGYVKREAVKELISLGAFMVTLIAYQATVDPVFRAVWKARLERVFGYGPRRDLEAEALEQVQREISLMEHGEFGEVPGAD